MKNIKRFLKLRYLFLGLLLWLVLRGTLNYSGFCWAEKRWLSDEELKIAGIKRFIRSDNPELYLKSNPDCCYINEPPKFDWRKYNSVDSDFTFGFPMYGDNLPNRLYGGYYKCVVIANKNKEVEQFEVNNCGKLFPEE